jgi:hypothetical protein
MHLIDKAALHDLDTWVRTGEPPPSAPRLTVVDAPPVAIDRDDDGIARGGVRTPPLDVPVDVLSGVPGPSPALICILLGSTTPLSDARLAALYPTRAAYEQRYDDAVGEAIDEGWVLQADRDALLAYAQPSRIPDEGSS